MYYRLPIILLFFKSIMTITKELSRFPWKTNEPSTDFTSNVIICKISSKQMYGFLFFYLRCKLRFDATEVASFFVI